MTMGSLSVLVLVLVAISSVQSQEPKCYSTFDFQEKLLEKMVALSHSVDTMERQFAKKMEELTDLSEKLKEDGIEMEAYIKKLGNEKSSEINEMSEKLKEDGIAMEAYIKKSGNEKSSEINEMSEKLKEDGIAMEAYIKKLGNEKSSEINEMSEKLKEDGIAMEAYIKKLGNEKSSEINEMSEKLKEDKISMETDVRREINNTVVNMTVSFVKTIGTANEKFDELVKTNDAKFGRLSMDLYTLANTTLKELQDSIKPNVAFLVRTVSDIAPGANHQQLIFTTAILNTDNSYSTDTGEFTAPVGGTYWFSVQICLYTNNYINIRIYVNDTVMSDSTWFDTDGGSPCTTVNTVAILTKGDRVYVKTGPNTFSGNIILQGTYRWSMFMGSLIN